ncbi:hypothetical protein NQ315_002932 [Exocentrus adspersus]|uniref:Kinetochore protein NDC80 n=1 Tax=Exocentrus adspersus TaxID=1586481 RepID=A0AAV8W4F6_9CUCU|nr:hypothetical protein NQ315_002932 [Exocentrus adspersus]
MPNKTIMYRRSNSASHIAVPKINLFGTADSKLSKIPRRSQSTSRLSQKDSNPSASNLRPQRNSSLDRKSSTVGLARTTPLLKPRVRTGSLQKTTPSSSISQRTGSSRGTTPLTGRKDRVTIQKLSTDKVWVGEQYRKVQNFIMSSNLFDLGVVDASNIKPPSINNFIYVTGILLMKIFPVEKISKENYKEIIPALLKVLKYPGTLTNSLLKTVNTIHSWPQVIGMWSWLIDKVNLETIAHDPSCANHLEPDERTKWYIRQNCMDFLIERFNIFNKRSSTDSEDTNKDDIDKVNNVYCENLAKLLDVDFEKYKNLENNVEKKRKYRDQQVLDIEKLKAEKQRLESQIEEMRTEIDEFKENFPLEEQELENELQLLQCNINDQKEAILSAKNNIAQLKEAIETQPCSYQEKIELLRQTEEIKKDIEIKRGKIEHAREIKNKFDMELAANISKIQSLVITWNRSFMEVSIKKPQLKKLLLREKGFHDAAFLEELQEVFKYKDVIEREITESLNKIEHDMKVEEKKCDAVKAEIEELAGIISHNNEEYTVAAKSVAEVRMNLDEVLRDWDEKKSCHAKQMKEMEDNSPLPAQLQTITELKNQIEKLTIEKNTLPQKIISFFIEMNEQVTTTLKEMEKIKRKLAIKLQDRQIKILEQQQEISQLLESFHEKETFNKFSE